VKILLVCTEKLPVPCVRGGAIQTYIDGILPHLSREHEITVFSVTDPNLPDREVRDGIRYERFPPGDSLAYYQAAANFVAEETFDWVIFYNRPKYLPLVADAAPKSHFLLSMHNEMFLPNKIDDDVARRCLERVEAVVTVSKFIADGIAERFPEYQDKLNPVYAGVDLERFQPRWTSGAVERRATLLAEYGWEGKKIVLYVGRLSEKKGPDILLRAFTQVIEQHPSAVLLLVGSKWYGKNEETKYVHQLRKKAKKLGDAVRLTGFISPDQVQDYFLLGDIFVCSSQWQEPLARVHYEAMATGLGIITTARGGNPEVIIPGKNGLLVKDYQNPDAFATHINYLLSDPKLAADMGWNGRQLSEKYFGWSRVASDILKIINPDSKPLNTSNPESGLLNAETFLTN